MLSQPLGSQAAPRCQRKGCSGSYGPEGYCDECGRRAPAESLSATALSGPTSAATLSGSTVAGSRGTRSRSSSRARLGAGLIEMPSVPRRDPATAVLTDPQVPESRRYCGQCDKPVGRGRDGQPGLTEGFCPHCRARYSFVPRLAPGDLISGRYEILGCLAHGGFGWIYLARDRNISDQVSDRWVVLKGLIDTGDPDSVAAAVNERRFLVEVDHPNIVKIHDFAQHPDPVTGTMVGYIVMEYVGGRSLRDILMASQGPDGRRVPLPLPQVLAYGLEVLPALGYLHDRGLLYCDFKPDNVIHAEEQLKLLDLGAVRRADDTVSAIYGTPGYQAPEVAKVGPSVASDIYTVGRTLAVLSFGLPGFTTTYADRLPDRAEVPLLVAEESFDRLLRRATHRDPERRFASAAEMSEQMRGVLREVLSAADAVPRPELSQQFTGERRVFGTESGLLPGQSGLLRGQSGLLPGREAAEVALALPLPQVDQTDPAAGFLATLSTTDPDELVGVLESAPVRTVEVALRLVRARIEQGDVDGAGKDLDGLAHAAQRDPRQLSGQAVPYDWRLDWYRGVAALAAGRPAEARGAFDAVYSALPGEPAAKLALAVAEEGRDDPGDLAAAARRYERVWRTDHGFVSAAFGLARLRLRQGDRAGCVGVLDEVPDSSSQHVTAQVAAVRARIGAELAQLAEADLLDASGRLERLRLDVERRAWLAAEMLERSLGWVRGTRRDAAGRVLGHQLSERALRLGLEQAYRALAKMARDDAERVRWVDQANSIRPRTWV
jgi:serine/threonine-protein kinase PknG